MGPKKVHSTLKNFSVFARGYAIELLTLNIDLNFYMVM